MVALSARSAELGARELGWIGLAVAVLAALPAAPREEGSGRLGLWLLTFALFFVLLGLAGSKHCALGSATRRGLVLSSTALAALALVSLGGGAFAATFPVITAAVAGSQLPRSTAFAFAGAQSVGLVAAFVVAGAGVASAVSYALIFGALQLFVVHTAQVARAESAARRALETAQERLAEASRDAERLRIARDLHDVMGHHLTALSLTLEAAAYVEGEAKEEAVSEAQVLTKRLLRDVRQVVSALREAPADFDSELRRLAADARGIAVSVDLPEIALDAHDELRRVLIRCAQETITNAARHGGAANLRLTVEASGGGLRFVARDDGRVKGADMGASATGNGLRGIRERVEALGGWVNWGVAADGGFELEAWLPAPAEGAR